MNTSRYESENRLGIWLQIICLLRTSLFRRGFRKVAKYFPSHLNSPRFLCTFSPAFRRHKEAFAATAVSIKSVFRLLRKIEANDGCSYSFYMSAPPPNSWQFFQVNFGSVSYIMLEIFMLLSVSLNIIVLHVRQKFLALKHYAQLMQDKFLPSTCP